MKKFTEYLDDYNFDTLVYLWNQYASENSYEYIYDNIDDYADMTEEGGVELARMVFFGDVRSWLDYVYINGNGNFKSCWDMDSSPIDIGAMAQWMQETKHEEFKTWMDNIDVDDFADWMSGELTKEELTEYWEEYIDEVDEDDLDDNGLPYDFDVKRLAQEMMDDWHQMFDDFIDSHI